MTAQQQTVQQHISRALRRLRRHGGETPATLAQKSGVPHAVLQRVESGEGELDIQSLVMVAHALGVAPAEFFLGLSRPTSKIGGNPCQIIPMRAGL